MKALTFHDLKTIRCETVADPEIQAPGDAIIKVGLSAICGSDLHVYFGREQGLDPGTAMGHEFMGEIVEVGADVRAHRKGGWVMCPFSTNCGACYFCRSGLTSRCQKGQLFGWVTDGRGLQGAQAEYVRVPLADSTLLAVPPELDHEAALLLGDIVATGYYCADMAAIHPDGAYVVIGCGPVGLLTISGAMALGATRLYALDVVPERLEKARALGAVSLNVSREAVVDAILDATGGLGADAVMEAVGSPQASKLAWELVRPGGIMAVTGVHYEPHFAFSPNQAYDKNLTLRMGRCPVRHYMPRLVSLVQENRLKLDGIVSHRISLEKGVHGYDIFAGKRDGCTKVILKP